MEKIKYHIYFGSHDANNLRQFEKPVIVFSPSSDKWNDFALRTRFTYKVVGITDETTSGEVHLAFLKDETTGDSDSPAELVEKLIRRSPNHLLPAKDLPGFYSMQFNLKTYREIVRQRGPAGAEEFLLAINDLVALKRTPRLPPWFSEATQSSQFKLAFMRDAEAFFAFHNAGSILGGLELESLRGISNRLRLEFQLPAFRNPHVLEFGFEYDSELPKRIAVVIGKNGVGKSQTLAHFAKSLLYGDRRLTDGDGKPPLIHRLLAVSSPGETRNTFPGPRKRSPIDYHRIILGRNSYGSGQSGLGDALVRLARSDETIREKGRWNLFCDAVAVVAPVNEIVVRFRKLKNSRSSHAEDPISLANLRHGGEQERLERLGNVDSRADVFRSINGQIFPFSSGQLTFIRFAAQACLHIENGTMVLFDEPETHLHPNYISDFVRLLDKLLADTGSFAILATHSAYLVREVPRSQVLVVRQSSAGVIEASPPRLKTLGADIGAISFFVFGDELYGKLLRDFRDQFDGSPSQANQTLAQLEGELSSEAVMYLRRELIAKKEK